MRCVLLFGIALVGCSPSVVARPVVRATPAVAPPTAEPPPVWIDNSTSVVATPSIPDAIVSSSTPYKFAVTVPATVAVASLA